jgi:hypothetical protein
VIEARRQPKDLPLVPTLLCLYGAGWIGGIAGSLVGGGPVAVATAQVRNSLVPLLLVQLASALVAAVAVRYLLRSVLGCEISLGAATAALVAGALVRTFGEFALFPTVGNLRDQASFAAVPVWIALGLVATFVSYLVLQHVHTFQPSVGAVSPYLDPYPDPATEDREPPPTFDHAGYDEAVDAVRETSAGLVDAATRAHLDEVADIVLRGVPYLEASTDALQRATPPAKVPPRLHQELVEDARTAHEELLTAARDAALGNDPRLRLADSEGMRRMRQALHELADLGVGTDW